ncbi:MAG: hypothetical protein M0Q26_13480 [Chitinophagaceae bacterium]|nr:hypothetical protein [Chitinophagaceae bacterium]
MKTFQSTPRLIYVDDLVHQLNLEITKTHQQIIQSSVLLEARSFADKNLPAPGESTLDWYLTSIMGQYKSLRSEVSIKLKGTLQRFLGTVGVTPLDEKINATKEAIVKEGDKIKNLETDKDRIQINSRYTGYKKHKWLLVLFALAECLLTISCFLKIGDIVIVALIVGVVIGLAQIYAAKTAVLFIREVENPRLRKRYCIIALTAFTLFSLVLGTMRYYFAHNGVASDIPFIILNPFSFAAINMLLVVASALLVFFFFPTKAELEQISHVEAIEDDIKKSIKQKNLLVQQHDNLINEKVKAVKIHGEVAHCEKELFEKIDAFYDEAVGKFKHENVTKRTDGAFPECFKHPHGILPVASDKEFNLLN